MNSVVSLTSRTGGLRTSKGLLSSYRVHDAVRPSPRGRLLIRAATKTEEEKKKEIVGKIEKSLQESGLDKKAAQEILKTWQNQVGHEVSPEDLRKILVGKSTKILLLVLINTILDAGAAYGAFIAGGFLGIASEQYGAIALVGQAIAYLLAGYYVTGAAFDLFKLGAVAFASITFNINSGSFLQAVEEIAGSGTGLDITDKARDAANSLKVLNALNKMADLLKENETSKKNAATSSETLLADLGAYLTLDKAQRLYGFDASALGITDEQAAEIAVRQNLCFSILFKEFVLNDIPFFLLWVKQVVFGKYDTSKNERIAWPVNEMILLFPRFFDPTCSSWLPCSL